MIGRSPWVLVVARSVKIIGDPPSNRASAAYDRCGNTCGAGLIVVVADRIGSSRLLATLPAMGSALEALWSAQRVVAIARIRV
jgi:hypothetical protein